MLHDRLIISLWYNSQMQILTLIKHGIIIFFKNRIWIKKTTTPNKCFKLIKVDNWPNDILFVIVTSRIKYANTFNIYYII